MMHSILEFLFVLTLGLTASGIVANLYRIVAPANETSLSHPLRIIVLAFSGPSEILESAIQGRIARQQSTASFWLPSRWLFIGA